MNIKRASNQPLCMSLDASHAWVLIVGDTPIILAAGDPRRRPDS